MPEKKTGKKDNHRKTDARMPEKKADKKRQPSEDRWLQGESQRGRPVKNRPRTSIYGIPLLSMLFRDILEKD